MPCYHSQQVGACHQRSDRVISSLPEERTIQHSKHTDGELVARNSKNDKIGGHRDWQVTHKIFENTTHYNIGQGPPNCGKAITIIRP